jgi:hypothetical protein
VKIRQQHKTPSDMKTRDAENAIGEMTDVINYYVHNYDLFSGGCCYSAYVLAKYLQKLGIKYKVVVFQYGQAYRKRRFKRAVRSGWAAHVAIEVEYENRWSIIGDCSGINAYFATNGFRFKCREYSRISPKEILNEYLHNAWNPIYDTATNDYVADDIRCIAEKYIEKYMND